MSQRTREEAPRPDAAVYVLAILPAPEDRSRLTAIFEHSRWRLDLAGNLQESRAPLQGLDPNVVITDCQLPDGGWKDVVQELGPHMGVMPVIVAASCADDRLWAEVLNLGAYDVLSTPFRADEVFRSVSLAWRHSRSGLVHTR